MTTLAIVLLVLVAFSVRKVCRAISVYSVATLWACIHKGILFSTSQSRPIGGNDTPEESSDTAIAIAVSLVIIGVAIISIIIVVVIVVRSTRQKRYLVKSDEL